MATLTRQLGLAVAIGALLTAITGLVPVRTLLGGTQYGLPFTWLVHRVLAPQYFPWRVVPIGLIADLVVWSVVGYVLLHLLATRQRPPT